MLTEEAQQKTEQLSNLISTYKFLIDSPLVKFFQDDVWSYVEDLGWSEWLLDLTDEELKLLPALDLVRDNNLIVSFPDSLKNFVLKCQRNSLGFSNPFPMEQSKNFTKFGMSLKKQHEVHFMGDAVRSILNNNDNNTIKQVIDFGSGKGYLPEYIALTSNAKVLGLDCEPINTAGAVERNALMERLWYPQHVKDNKGYVEKLAKIELTHYLPITLRLDESHATPRFMKMMLEKSGDFLKEQNTILVGLHACGNLSALLLQTFLESTSLSAIMSVGCCYHLIEQREVGLHHLREVYSIQPPLKSDSVTSYPLSQYNQKKPLYFSRNSLNLASQAPERMVDSNKLPDRNIFYRAVLQVLLHDHFLPNKENVGSSATKEKDFVNYTRAALNKLKLDHTTLNDETIVSYLNKYTTAERKLYVFYQLRTVMTRVIESMILMDRLLYLREQGTSCEIYNLFDPVKSPRCYVIAASKPKIAQL